MEICIVCNKNERYFKGRLCRECINRKERERRKNDLVYRERYRERGRLFSERRRRKLGIPLKKKIDYSVSKICEFCKRRMGRIRPSGRKISNDKEWVRKKFCSRECLDKSLIGKKQPENLIEKRRQKLLENYRTGRMVAWQKGRKREGSILWKGGRNVTSAGYIELHKPNHSEANQRGYVFEHRWVMENYLKRPLKESEVVHHKNGMKGDNRIENLEVMDANKHKKLHAKSAE